MSLQIITLQNLKDNARIETSAEDTYLTGLCEVAEQAVLDLLDRSYSDIIVEYGTVPAPIKHGCILMATHLYEHRSPVKQVQMYTVPYTLDAMLKPYIKF